MKQILTLSLFTGKDRKTNHLFALLKVDQANPLGIAANDPDRIHGHADNLGTVGNKHNLVFILHLQGANHLAVARTGADGKIIWAIWEVDKFDWDEINP